MLFVSLLQRLGFPSETAAQHAKPTSLQSRPKPGPLAVPSDPAGRSAGLERPRGIRIDQPVQPVQNSAQQVPTRRSARPPDPVPSGTQRRPVVKASATSTAKAGKPAAPGSTSGAANAPPAAASRKAAAPAAKPATAASLRRRFRNRPRRPPPVPSRASPRPPVRARHPHPRRPPSSSSPPPSPWASGRRKR
jgi:hypothetical protein